MPRLHFPNGTVLYPYVSAENKAMGGQTDEVTIFCQSSAPDETRGVIPKGIMCRKAVAWVPIGQGTNPPRNLINL